MTEIFISEIRDAAIEWGKKIIAYGDPDYYIPFTLALKGYDEIITLIDEYRKEVKDDTVEEAQVCCNTNSSL